MDYAQIGIAVAANAKSAGIDWNISELPLLFRLGHTHPNIVAFAMMVAVYQSCNWLLVDGILNESTYASMRERKSKTIWSCGLRHLC